MTILPVTPLVYSTPDAEPWKQRYESAIWREFACAAIGGIVAGSEITNKEVAADYCADIADAMLEEARKRGKL